MKIAIITWIRHNNFGTVLQAYALQKVVNSLGYDNAIIDDDQFIRNLKWPFFIRQLKHLIINLLKGVSYYLAKYKSDKLFISFKAKYINVDKTSQHKSELDNNYDIFIIGSDQIWNPLNFNSYFYADFTNKPKISYAPSLGICDEYPTAIKDQVASLLSSFKAISVRETKGKALLNTIYDKPIFVALDPTLLLTINEWNSLTTTKSPFKSEYILCYLLTYNEAYLHWVRLQADKQQKMLVIIANLPKMNRFADVYYPAGPQEFLSAIKYADFIYTDSYHGTIFSIIFEKEFITLKRFYDGDKINQNYRLEHLFQLLSINDRFLSEKDLAEKIPGKLDYGKIMKTIEIERLKSKTFLNESLKSI